MPLVNFHNHSQSVNNSNLIAIKSLNAEKTIKLEPNGLYTIGLHPWKTDKPDANDQIETINELLANDLIIGLGEVGLDKLRGASIELQKKYLVKQVELAYEMNKPIIIHCVKAWDELLEIRKPFSNKIPWAIHGFNGSEQLTKQLIAAGYYLSVGESIKNDDSRIAKTIKKIPLNRLFLETDDSEIGIDAIYDLAATRIQEPLNKLEDQLYNNFREFFENCPTSKIL